MRLKSRIMNLLIHGDRQWTEDSLEGDGVMSSRLDRHILGTVQTGSSSATQPHLESVKII